jgi:hypothetical protein
MDGLSRARECECGRVTLESLNGVVCASSPCPTTDSSGVLSAKRRAARMTRACHSILKGYLTYTGGQYL